MQAESRGQVCLLRSNSAGSLAVSVQAQGGLLIPYKPA